MFDFHWNWCNRIERWPPIGQCLQQIDFDGDLSNDLALQSIPISFCRFHRLAPCFSLSSYQSKNGTSSGVWLLCSRFNICKLLSWVLMSWNRKFFKYFVFVVKLNRRLCYSNGFLLLSVRINEFAFKLSSCYQFQFQNTTKTMTLISDCFFFLENFTRIYVRRTSQTFNLATLLFVEMDRISLSFTSPTETTYKSKRIIFIKCQTKMNEK